MKGQMMRKLSKYALKQLTPEEREAYDQELLTEAITKRRFLNGGMVYIERDENNYGYRLYCKDDYGFGMGEEWADSPEEFDAILKQFQDELDLYSNCEEDS